MRSDLHMNPNWVNFLIVAVGKMQPECRSDAVRIPRHHRTVRVQGALPHVKCPSGHFGIVAFHETNVFDLQKADVPMYPDSLPFPPLQVVQINSTNVAVLPSESTNSIMCIICSNLLPNPSDRSAKLGRWSPPLQRSRRGRHPGVRASVIVARTDASSDLAPSLDAQRTAAETASPVDRSVMSRVRVER